MKWTHLLQIVLLRFVLGREFHEKESLACGGSLFGNQYKMKMEYRSVGRLRPVLF